MPIKKSLGHILQTGMMWVETSSDHTTCVYRIKVHYFLLAECYEFLVLHVYLDVYVYLRHLDMTCGQE